MNSHANVARPSHLAHLHHAFDALKRSATALFARRPAPYTSTTPSNTRSDASNIVHGACMSTPHLSGTAIVASVGLGYSPFTRPSPLPRLLLHSAGELSNPSRSAAISLLDGLDIDIDVEPTSDEAPPAVTASLSAQSTTVRSSIASSSTTNDISQPKSIRATSEAESTSSSTASTPYASSSTGSDSSFECATPPTAAEEVRSLLEPRIQFPSSITPSSDAPVRSTWLDVHRALDALEANVSKLLEQSEEVALPTSGTQPSSPQGDAAPQLDIIYYDDDESCPDVEAESSPEDDAALDAETSEDESEAGDDADDSDDTRPPTVLRNPHTGGTYFVEGVVADGGFARVVQVVDDKGQRRAAKIAHKRAVCKRAGARDGLLREKAFMVKTSEIGSRRLVGLIESWEDEENIYFIMVRVSFGAPAIYASHAASLGTLPLLSTGPAESPRRLR